MRVKNHTRETKATYYAPKPAWATLHKERSQLRCIFTWAKGRGIIGRIPTIETEDAPDIESRKRPSFSPAQYDKLRRAVIGLRQRKTNRSDVKRRRIRLWAWVLLLSNTGLRPQEARLLKWNQVDLRHFEDGKFTIISITARQSKVNKTRDVISRDFASTWEHLQDWRRYTRAPEDNDYIFPSDVDSKRPANMEHTFRKLLESVDLYYDEDGRTRSSYSLRHFYFDMRLKNGVPIYVLAENGGTSVGMIEQWYKSQLTVNMRQWLTRTGKYIPNETTSNFDAV